MSLQILNRQVVKSDSATIKVQFCLLIAILLKLGTSAMVEFSSYRYFTPFDFD